MATAKTLAKINAKDGIPVHKHDNFGWHWASAGHRDEGKIHTDAGADKPEFMDGTTAEQKTLYTEYFTRKKVAQIPSKAKAKSATPSKDGEAQTISGKDVAELRTPVGAGASNSNSAR